MHDSLFLLLPPLSPVYSPSVDSCSLLNGGELYLINCTFCFLKTHKVLLMRHYHFFSALAGASFVLADDDGDNIRPFCVVVAFTVFSCYRNIFIAFNAIQEEQL